MTNHSTADFSKSTKSITLEDLILTKSKWEIENIAIPQGIEVSPAVYRRLHELLGSKDLTIQTFHGLEVIVDPKLKHGEWRFTNAHPKVEPV